MMKYGLVIPILALLLVGCGDDDTPANREATRDLDPHTEAHVLRGHKTDIDLPLVGTVWQKPLQGATLDASVTQAGRLAMDGLTGPLPSTRYPLVPYARQPIEPGEDRTAHKKTLREFKHQILRATDKAGREPDGASALSLVIHADGAAPWGHVESLMAVCAGPDTQLYKIFLAADSAETDGTGVLPYLLPKDNGLTTNAQAPAERVELLIKLFRRGRDDPATAYTLIRIGYAPPHYQLPEGWKGRAHETPIRVEQHERVVATLRAAIRRHIKAGGGLRRNSKAEVQLPPPYGATVPTGDVVSVLSVLLEAGLYANVSRAAAERVLEGELPNDTTAAKGKQIQPLRAHMEAELIEEDLDEVEEDEVTEDEIDAEEPVIKDEEIEDHVEKDNDLPLDTSDDDNDADADEPFQGPASNGTIGIGGAWGSAFRSRAPTDASHTGPGRVKYEDAVDDALRWLAAHQSPNGGWEAADFNQWCDGKKVADASKQPDGRGRNVYDPGVTGLALCAFLGAGYTHRGKHPFARVVSRGLRYLKAIQDREGCFGPRSTQQYIYSQATATLAMVEAYGMTGSPLYKGSAQRALDFIARARNPHAAWRYGIKPGDNDTSVSGWMLSALHSARLVNADALKRSKAAPFKLDEHAFEGVRTWLDKVTDKDIGRVAYTERHKGPARPEKLVDRFPPALSESMTAAGVLSRIFMGTNPHKSTLIERGADLCLTRLPTWNPTNGAIDFDYWYFGTLALYQIGGDRWLRWRRAMDDAMVKTQRKDTDYCQFKGSWDPIDPWGLDGGRVYSTAMLALNLEVFRRYDRIFAAPAK